MAFDTITEFLEPSLWVGWWSKFFFVDDWVVILGSTCVEIC